MKEPNKPAAPNAGIASRLTIGHHWPGVGEPGRSAACQLSFMRNLIIQLVCIGFLLVLSGCALPVHLPKTNYLGLKRDQIARMTEQYPKFLNNQIMIQVPGGYRYFSSAEEILADKQVMSAPSWGVNFRRLWYTTRYYELTFEDDVVIKQEKVTALDAS
jgi:hypothetical protein